MRCPRCHRGYELGIDACEVDGAQLRQTRGRTLIGRVLAGRFQLESLLGSGGMGEVYRAHHLLLDKPIALKVVLPSLADRSAAVALLRREARNASRVDHPNVVRVYDLEFDRALLFLTMDYVPGPTLSEIIDSSGPCTPQVVSTIIDQIAQGLEAIHATAIVHRDLKPSNVVLTRKSDGPALVRLLDFGIARAFDDPDQSITRSGLVVGTPVFMSPEQRAGIALDRRADVFGMGALAAYLLAGSLPRLGADVCLRLSDIPQAAKWPDPLRHALLHALMWERSQRASSAERFASALRQAVASLPPSPVPTSLEELLTAGPWRLRTMAGAPERMSALKPPNRRATPTLEVGRAVQQSGSPPRSVSPPPKRTLAGVRLRAVSGPLEGEEFPVTAAPLYIGRDPKSCQVTFPDSASFVSRIHASLLWNDARGRFVLMDEGSKNATTIIGARSLEPGEPVDLLPGQMFSVGHPDFVFCVLRD